MITLFFISGLSRSGTTLLEKLLHNHKEIAVASQPFPFLYRFVKQKFFETISYPSTRYVLNNLFMERWYSRDDLDIFLKDFVVTAGDLHTIFDQMKSFSGQLTKQYNLSSITDHYQSTDLFGTFRRLIAEMNSKPAGIVGAKEINCEEFFEYFLQNGIRCINVIRDPRDVITSLNVGDGTKYGGDHRPTLFHVRNWRKSVAFSLLFESDPNFLTIRYEDLVNNPLAELNRICSFLGASDYDQSVLTHQLRDQSGSFWKPNSSLADGVQEGAVSKRSLESFRSFLLPEMIRFVEHTCFPEMQYFGYLKSYPSEAWSPVAPLKEQFPVTVKDLPSNLSADEANLKEETLRLALFREALESASKISDLDAKLFYLDRQVLAKLARKGQSYRI